MFFVHVFIRFNVLGFFFVRFPRSCHFTEHRLGRPITVAGTEGVG